ncbi:histidine kinase [Streptomyces alanosinicus]|uniref:histidine kinase n=1 Tax=Streptomyces alanosinicus TaxID=68171 RepID=UPI001E58DC28|nr:histidine kinase [Streptomyces alanosinicus]
MSLLVGVVRRMPLLALVMALFGSTAVVVGPPSSAHESRAASYQGQFLSYLAVDLVLGFIVATCARRASTVAVAVSFTVQLLVIGVLAHGDSLAVNGVIALPALAASCMAGLLSRERREHAVALRAQEVAEAVTTERLLIARELHDMVAHSIGIIAIQAGVGSRVIQTQPAEARDALRAIEATSRETLSGFAARWCHSVRPTEARPPRSSHRSHPRRGWRISNGWRQRPRAQGYASTCAAPGSSVPCRPTSTCPPTASCRRR